MTIVPVQYQRILACTTTSPAATVSSFRAKFCTSAPFRPAVKADGRRALARADCSSSTA
jgi:hypothetical protein